MKMRGRPRTRCLAQLFDEGADAAEAGTQSPYEPPRGQGDGIRHWLWEKGYEAGLVRKVYRELVGDC